MSRSRIQNDTNQKSGPGNLKFPIATDPTYRTRISFQAIRVLPPDIAVRFSSSETAKGADPGFGNALRKQAASTTVRGNSLLVYEIAGEKTDLYMPVSFQVNDGFDYATASLGLLGMGGMAAANRGESIAGSVMEGIKEGVSSVASLFGSGALSRVAAVRASQNLGDTARSAVSITARASMNPNLRTQFNGVSVREFNFSFKFIPRSREESQAVKDIIRFFRFHAYPHELEENIAFEYPNMFRIKLLSKGEDERFKNIGTPIKLCYLKTVSTVYNPTSPVLHPDGSPTEVDMNLTFTEYKALSRNDVVNEENDTFYQYEGRVTQRGV